MTSMSRLSLLCAAAAFPLIVLLAQEPAPTPRAPQDPMSTPTFNDLRLRLLGPAFTSGRVATVAVDPSNRSRFFVAAASGGVWRTTNGGVTFTPVFDTEGSYSIGAMALDPKNPSTVWVGTGENNSQRSVSYGDGVYKSDDSGRTWKNVGLKKSEHIGKIVIDPRNTDVVYVAAQGPLWGPGGDRGLYKTTDGGKTWKDILTISENTGVSDIAMDPRNPDLLYASAYQRRRHVWTLIDGGPESGLYKSTDAGATWNKVRTGLPNVDLGRIGLAVSPANPDVVYATVEAAERRGGIFRSLDRGATWERMNPFDQGAMYYGVIFADPKVVDRIYIPNTNLMVSDDGGRTVRQLGERSKHVDNHVIWIDPKDTNYYLVGCDGGLYQSFDRGENWDFFPNLPIEQFYDIAVDNAAPFYNVYGGTQDNNSQGGPARTRNTNGIVNSDWFVTDGGDGFRSLVDPDDPDTVYAESQYGGMVRFNRKNGERTTILPPTAKGEESMRQNWDTPFIISPHSHTRLYYGGNRLYRSDNRGDDWQLISPDLTRKIDRDSLPVMGKVWPPEAVAKNASTAPYGNVSALAESPKKDGLIYAGTDDGLIQVTENGGESWRKIETFPGVPANTYVSRIVTSQFDTNTVYAAFDNHQSADFAPYLLRSTDAGRTWSSMKGNLPANGTVYAIAEDFINPDLIFAGTEYGLFFTVNGGEKWIQLKSGLPNIAVRDLAIQKRENDLVLATFGRGIYVLDDYSPLRTIKADTLKTDALTFTSRDTLMYVQSSAIGGRGKGSQGERYYTAANPPYGATLTYYLKDALKTKRQIRQDAQREATRGGKTIAYPTRDELQAETDEEAPAVVLTITDAQGNVVRRLDGPATAGFHRVTWDLRYPAPVLAAAAPQRGAAPGADDEAGGGGGGGEAAGGGGGGGRGGQGGYFAMPGTYSFTIATRQDGVVKTVASKQNFKVAAEGTGSMSAADRAALTEFQQKLSKLQRTLSGANDSAGALKTRLGSLKRAMREAPSNTQGLVDETATLERRTDEIIWEFRGLPNGGEGSKPGLTQRVNAIAGRQVMAATRPTRTQIDQYNLTADEFKVQFDKLKTLVETDLPKLEKAAESAGAPWTSGRLPEWSGK
jgi:photosystem II stability/assembly factor-like uncharacterized protein